MSDIPVGSPPVPPGRHAAPGGWYADPVDPARERYWDGWQWSRNTRPRESQPPPAAGGRPTGYAPPGPAVPPGPAPGSGYPGPTPGGYAPGPTPDGYAPPPGYPVAPGYGYPPVPVPATADGVPLAGWWWRVLAMVIDIVLLSTVVTILAAPVWLPIYEAFAAYFQAVVEAAQAGAAAPPVMDPNQLVPVRAQVILTALSVGLGLALPRRLPAVEGRDPGQAGLPAARGPGRPGPASRTAGLGRGRSPGPRSGCCRGSARCSPCSPWWTRCSRSGSPNGRRCTTSRPRPRWCAAAARPAEADTTRHAAPLERHAEVRPKRAAQTVDDASAPLAILTRGRSVRGASTRQPSRARGPYFAMEFRAA